MVHHAGHPVHHHWTPLLPYLLLLPYEMAHPLCPENETQRSVHLVLILWDTP